MKKMIIITIVLMLSGTGLCLATTRDTVPAFTTGEYNPAGNLISIAAKGLVCDFCAQALQKVFMKEEAVAGVHVDLSTKEILVSLKEGFDMDDEAITKLVTDSGYNVAGITRL